MLELRLTAPARYRSNSHPLLMSRGSARSASAGRQKPWSAEICKKWLTLPIRPSSSLPPTIFVFLTLKYQSGYLQPYSRKQLPSHLSCDCFQTIVSAERCSGNSASLRQPSDGCSTAQTINNWSCDCFWGCCFCFISASPARQNKTYRNVYFCTFIHHHENKDTQPGLFIII